jgi:hypothetical protein
VLRTPGLQGTAEAHPPASDSMRAAEHASEELDAALDNENVSSQETIEIVDTAVVDVGATPTRSTTYDEPAIEVEVTDPGENFGQIVLYVDEAGVISWNFARDQSLAIDTTRGGATRTYVLRRAVPPAPSTAETRGLIGAGGKKLLKVLVFPIIDPLIGEVADYFAGKWEQKKRPYRVRPFTPDDYSAADAQQLDGAAWKELSHDRALLFVHGTFSRAHSAFAALPRDYVGELHSLYDGRVFAFDHFTLSETPKQNIEWFVDQLPDGSKLELDIVCHSRGGLVSRMLAEKQSELSLGSKSIDIRKIVFVATPNAGTVLTDKKHLGDFIDTYTNLLNFFPDTGIVEILEAVITVAKQLALDTIAGLDGLQSMLPNGPFLSALNSGARDDKQYFALASDYEPPAVGIASFRDFLMDKIFDQDNDLVVPTAGVYDKNGSGRFPIEDKRVFQAADSIPHSGYFARREAREQITEWLAA